MGGVNPGTSPFQTALDPNPLRNTRRRLRHKRQCRRAVSYCDRIDRMKIPSRLCVAWKPPRKNTLSLSVGCGKFIDEKGVVLVEENADTGNMIQAPFISKQCDRQRAIDHQMNVLSGRQAANLASFRSEILSIVHDHEQQKVTQMSLKRSLKLNSNNYFLSIVCKCLYICSQVDSRMANIDPDVVRAVKLEAMYIYRHIILETGNALRRVRTPSNQLNMCHKVAALVNGLDIGMYDTDELCTTSLIQFVSGLPPYYSRVVPLIGETKLCINSTARRNNLTDEERATLQILVEFIGLCTKTLADKKPNNTVQGVYAFLRLVSPKPPLHSSPTSVVSSTAKHIADNVSAICSRHRISKADIDRTVSLRLRRPLLVNFRNPKLCAISLLMSKTIEAEFESLF